MTLLPKDDTEWLAKVTVQRDKERGFQAVRTGAVQRPWSKNETGVVEESKRGR